MPLRWPALPKTRYSRIAGGVEYRERLAVPSQLQSTENQTGKDDPRRNLFWWFIAFLGTSIPQPGQERRAIVHLAFIGVLVAAITAAAILTIFKFW